MLKGFNQKQIFFALALVCVVVSGCTAVETSIRKTFVDRVGPTDPVGLSWVQVSPRNSTSATATWTVSTSTDLADQKIQFFTGAACNTAATLIDLSSSTTSSQALVGVDGTTYTYEIISTDAKGNTTTSPCSSAMMIDTTSPTLTITSASSPTWIDIANSTVYPVIGTCSDATSGISGNVIVTINDGAGNSKTLTPTCAAFIAGITVDMTTGFAPAPAAVDGTNNITISAQVSDAATNLTSTSITRSKDVVAPALTITSAFSPTWINVANKAAYPLRGTCSDATSGLNSINILITDTVNSKIVTTTCATFSGGLFTIDMTTGFAPGALAEGAGNVFISAQVADVATNSTTTATIARSKDTIAPTVTSLTSTTANGSYHYNQTVAIQMTMNENVTVAGGTPLLTLNTAPSNTASYVSTAANVLSFSYTVGGTDMSAALDYASTGAFALGGATITDVAGNSAILTLPALASANSISPTKSIVIDTTPVLSFNVGGANPANPALFGNPVSSNQTLTFIVRNLNGQTSSAITTSITGANAAAYCKGASCAPVITDTCNGMTITYLQTCTIQVTFLAGTLFAGTYNTATLNAAAVTGGTAQNTLNGTVACPVASKTTFTSDGSYTVPGGCVSLAFKAWGGGGASSGNSNGGAGGYATGALVVTPGQTTIGILVGGNGSTSLHGGGVGRGNGGGYSGVTISAVTKLFAGGGGGGAFNNAGNGAGGAGGGATAQNGNFSSATTQGSGGAGAGGAAGADTSACGGGGAGYAAATSGSSLQGGNAATCANNGGQTGGGGGGGYFGGGGGGLYLNAGSLEAGGGGGGSSFVNGAIFTGGSTTVGALTVPGNSGDGDRGGSGGEGGTAGGAGTAGKVVVITP